MILDIWSSFRRLPLWVQLWMALILVPINLAALAFWNAPYGVWVAVLAVGGMLPNLVIMAAERGMSSLMAWPHVFIWTPLCLLVAWMLYQYFAGALALSTSYAAFLVALLVIDVISLAFDFPDALKWLRGDRAIA